jgi:hypothetical protein
MQHLGITLSLFNSTILVQPQGHRLKRKICGNCRYCRVGPAMRAVCPPHKITATETAEDTEFPALQTWQNHRVIIPKIIVTIVWHFCYKIAADAKSMITFVLVLVMVGMPFLLGLAAASGIHLYRNRGRK